jgi:uncharacterized protein
MENRPQSATSSFSDLADGSAWVSSITFRMPMLRPSWLPPVPGLRLAIESHLRTYVVDPEGRRGIWMLSLDIDPIAAAAIGRAFALPYWAARSTVERDRVSATYRSQRLFPGRGRLELELDLGAELPDEDGNEMDEFLTSRWILYAGVRSRGCRGLHRAPALALPPGGDPRPEPDGHRRGGSSSTPGRPTHPLF